MNVVVSGQAVPIATKGIFLVNGVDQQGGTITAGSKAYAHNSGLFTNVSDGTIEVGKFLGAKDDNGDVLIKLNL